MARKRPQQPGRKHDQIRGDGQEQIRAGETGDQGEID